VLGIVFRPEGLLFFGDHEQYQQRTARMLRERRKRPRGGQHLCASQRVVNRAVVDAIAGRIWLPDPQVIVMRRQHHQLLRQLGI
jgi:hypothetical protein